MATIDAPSELAERLAAARRAAVAAGRETLRWFRNGDLAVTLKADRSPVTQADLAAEEVLRRELLGAFPDDGFLGEETGATRGRSVYEWVCDPIDGTKSFIHGVPLYATLVGCRRCGGTPEAAGSPIVGVIAIPAMDESVFAAVGSGAWHQWGDAEPTPARVSATTVLSDGLFVTSDVTSFDARGRRDARDALEATCRLSRTWGDGYGYLLVATGRAEAMVDPLLNPWDAAAVMPVIVEAGGRFSDWRGQPRIDSGDGVATNGLVHAEVLEILRQRS